MTGISGNGRSVLRTEEVSKSYRKRRVVDNISVSVATGEVVGLLGPNGAGKTTTFYMIVGMVTPDGGRIFLDDREITDLAMYERARAGISYLPQEPSVFRRLSVEDNLLAILETLPLRPADRRMRLEELIEQMGLEAVRKNKGYALSGGERRRVEIARALVTRPSFMLLDEPFSGIDPISVQEIQRIILALKQENIGLIVTDHNVRETLKVTDYAYLMNDGKILSRGNPQEITQDPLAKRFYLGEGFQLS